MTGPRAQLSQAPRSRSKSRDVWLVIGFVVLFIVAVVTLVVERVQRRRDVDRRSQIDCSFRLVHGLQDGITPKWVTGAAVISPGLVNFQPMVGGIRFLTRPCRLIPVISMDSMPLHQASWKEAMKVAQGSDVVVIKTPTAQLEWALPRGQGRSGWAIEAVTPQDEPT